MKKLFLIFAVLVGLSTTTHAITFNENLLFTAELSGAQVVPAVSSSGKGVASLMLDKFRDSISITMSMNGLSGLPTGVQLWLGPVGANGSQLIDLSAFLSGNWMATRITGTVVTTHLPDLFKEELYLLVTTAAHPSGELRGQIRLESDWNFAADLSGLNALPVVVGPAYGLGSFSLSQDKTKLDYRIICQNLSGAITGAMLHVGASGQTGPQLVDITPSVNGNVITGSFIPSANLLDSLVEGKIYCNITTANNPSGELRAQLYAYKGLTFEAIIDGAQMVPVLASPAQGISIIRLSPDLDTLYYDAVIDNVSSAINFAHLHVGYAGLPYGALQVDFTSSIVGHRIKGYKAGAPVTSTLIKRLLISNLAFLVHTATYPNGEIRGEVLRYAQEGLTINCEGSQVVSPVSTAAYGSGFVSINRNETNLHYVWVAGNLSSPATAAHFNANVVGQNGPVVYDLTPLMMAQGGEASASGYWKSTDATPFLAADAAQFQADSIYLEIANSLYPGGELRGQVEHGLVFYTPTDLGASFSENTIEWAIYPIPASNAITVELNTLQTQPVILRITDVLGQTVFLQAYSGGAGIQRYLIDVATLTPGVYFVALISEQTNQSLKIIKN